MASSSSTCASNSTQLWNYDVFLCFRGSDTRNTFVGHLYTALDQREIVTFNDKETLPYGVPIYVTLLKVIRESRIAVVVFSKDFASSTYCLNELENIISCRDEIGQIVIPIFYHVQPSDVFFLRGEFSLDILESRYNKNKVESWRYALREAGAFSGWVVEDSIRKPEPEVIKDVVDTIWKKLFPYKGVNESGIPLQDLKLSGGVPSSTFYTAATSSAFYTSVTSSFSNSHPSKLGNYDVFLSFHEEDTHSNFVDHLYSALEEHEIHTYNYIKIESSGPIIHSHTIKAIENSRISIIIFSEHYASSSLCMDECAYIMKCRKERENIVIPLFYYVEPSYVRRQRGSYAEAFSKHESISKVELWKKTLEDAGNLNGWEMGKIADGNEAKGIQIIVKKISNILFPDKELIGLHTRLGEMKYGGGGTNTIQPSSNIEKLRIPLHEILSATNNFSEDNIVAKGGFGYVYRGQSEKLGTVAVKKLERRQGGQGDLQFIMEIGLLSTYKHENIVSLVGFCDQDGERILVLKFEINGSLDRHLDNKNLTWIQRLQICLDSANGLKYLHEDVRDQHIIFHRDVKCANILLDENWRAKISDFGLSKVVLAKVPYSVIISGICGTMGYIDPQYRDHNMLTQKSDVYSFGVVLFEVLCSKSVNAQQYRFSAELAKNHYEKETLDEIVDSGLRSQMNSDCLRTYSSIAYECLMTQRDKRPTMGRVVNQLKKALDYQQGSNGYLHDVYISFRQRDTECHIVKIICGALHQQGVTTYEDEVTISRNESIILNAIEHSRLFIIVFTKKFGVNSWYLDEVAKIIECMKEKGQFLLPVFLNVSRSDVRTQKGYFGEVMSEYDTHPRMEVWRNALIEATNPPGLEYSKFRSSEDFVKRVAEDVKLGLVAEHLSSLQV